MSKSVGDRPLLERDHLASEPVTDYHSKMVMLRSERHDEIAISEIVTQIRRDVDVPLEATIVQRQCPYFGPKLLLHAGEENYLLTAPGPDTHLLLWSPEHDEYGERCGWTKLAEVKAQFVDDQPQYDLCPECGKPMQTLEHERKSAVGRCPGPDV